MMSRGNPKLVAIIKVKLRQEKARVRSGKVTTKES